MKSELITGGSREQRLENALTVLLNLIEDDSLIYNPEDSNSEHAQAAELVAEAEEVLHEGDGDLDTEEAELE